MGVWSPHVLAISFNSSPHFQLSIFNDGALHRVPLKKEEWHNISHTIGASANMVRHPEVIRRSVMSDHVMSQHCCY